MGADVGYAVLQKNDSEGIYDSDSKVSPSITNLTDSDGLRVLLVRDFNL